jgi:hypothetical protein
MFLLGWQIVLLLLLLLWQVMSCVAFVDAVVARHVVTSCVAVVAVAVTNCAAFSQ